MDQKQNEDLNTKGMGDEVLKSIHNAKSYVGSAWITLLLYYIGFYIIGLIVNLVFLSKAKNTKRITNNSPSGKGCLTFLLWTHLIIPILFILGLMGAISLPFLN